MRYVCLGDSLTEGFMIGQSWVELLDTGDEYINKGICGDTTSGMVTRFKNDVIVNEPDCLVLMGGTNDIFMETDIKFIIENIYYMLRMAIKEDIQILLGIPPKTYIRQKFIFRGHEAEIDEVMEDYRQSLMLFCQENDINYIDFNQGLSTRHYFRDGVHPNQKGHKVMAENFVEQVYSV